MSETGSGLRVGRRVIVTGLAGAGKSTFSRALGAKTGLPVIHLDLHAWKPGWVRMNEDELREKQRDLLVGEEWIADGNYHKTLDLRLGRADTVVFLDTTLVDLRTTRVHARNSPTARLPATRRLRGRPVAAPARRMVAGLAHLACPPLGPRARARNHVAA